MLTGLKILLVIYLLFIIYIIIKYEWWKVKVILRWLNTFILYILAHILIPFYPIAYATRKSKYRLFSWLLDDGRFNLKVELTNTGVEIIKYAKDYRIWLTLKGYTEETWMSAFRWHIGRNRLYNLLEKFIVYNGKPLVGNQFITVIENTIDNLYKNDKNKTPIAQDGIYVATAGLKYIGKKGQDLFQVNQGEIISIKTSILGTGLIWYRVEYKDKNGKIKYINYFRYSQCKIVKYPLFGSYYRTLKFGTNSSRNTFTVKHQLLKTWK